MLEEQVKIKALAAEALASVPRVRAKRRHDEDDAQEAIVEFLRIVLPKSHRVFSIPNGGARSKVEAAILKRTGVLAGIPDLCVLGPHGFTFWIETKAATGQLSKAQREMRAWMGQHQIPLVVARSIDDVRVALRRWGLPTREAS